MTNEPIEKRKFENAKENNFEVKKALEKAEKSPEEIKIPEMNQERKEGQSESEEAYAKILSKVSASKSPTDDDIAGDANQVSLEKSAAAKVEKLVGLAMEKGILHAVRAAKHLEDNYVLDEFHDKLLADELHQALIKKGLIKEI